MNADLTEKKCDINFEKIHNFFESIYKNENNNYKNWWYSNTKQAFHQHKRLISIKNVDMNETVVFNRISFGKNEFKYFIGYKDSKKLDLYVYFSQKWMQIEKTLMKLNMHLFDKGNKLLEKYNEICKKVTNSLKRKFNNKPIYNEKYLKTRL